jgi:hypothetical protein
MMGNFLKVEGNPSLVRDMETKAILNNNSSDYENYLRKRDSMLSSQEMISRHTEEITEIKEDLSQIKNMLMALLNKKTV